MQTGGGGERENLYAYIHRYGIGIVCKEIQCRKKLCDPLLNL